MRYLILFFVSTAAFASTSDCGLGGTGLNPTNIRPGTLYAVRHRLRIEFKNGEALSQQMESELDRLSGAIGASNLNIRISFNGSTAQKTLTVAFSISEPKAPKFDEAKPVFKRTWNIESLPNGNGRLIPRAPSVARIDPSQSVRDVEGQVNVLLYGEGIRLPH